MKRFLVFFIFNFSFYLFLTAQQTWYFGNGAGIKFSKEGVQLLHDGKIYTNEGCSAAYNEKGELIFYSDGITVWNKNHSVFKNGEGLNGNRSSTQSVLIVSKPLDKNLFYVFTTDEKAGEKGLCYSVVDIKTSSVILKNKLLLTNCAEKLTAISNKNGKDIWIIAQDWNSNSFYTYPITSSGVGNPVVSSLSVRFSGGDVRQAIGYLRVSNNGKKLAEAFCYTQKENFSFFDFDNSTGKISNPLLLSLDGFPYGVCFSPDDSKLYISFLSGKSGVVQYDFQTKNITDIIPNEKENSFGGLQTGMDGKIYVARTGNFLDVISFPNKSGSGCVYKKNAVDLSSGSCAYGLPNIFITGISNSENPVSFDCTKIIEMPFSKKGANSISEIVTCDEQYSLNAKNFGAAIIWSTMESTPKISVDTSGIYKVSITKDGCALTDSTRIRFRKDMAVFRYLPAFNPESDFLNSEFYYSIEEVYDFDLKVFDRKNKILFETKNIEQKWNGKNPKGELLPAGEYNWEVKFRPQCPKDAKSVIQKGKVTVKRSK